MIHTLNSKFLLVRFKERRSVKLGVIIMSINFIWGFFILRHEDIWDRLPFGGGDDVSFMVLKIMTNIRNGYTLYARSRRNSIYARRGCLRLIPNLQC